MPPEVRSKLGQDPPVPFVAGVIKRVTLAEIRSGTFEHLGLALVNGTVTSRTRITPLAEMGRYSRRNREGWEVIRRDLPKVWKSYSFEVPNFGDWSKGSHDVTQHRLIFRRDVVGAPQLAITIEHLAEHEDSIVYRFAIDAPLDSAAAGFEELLLLALNLLQENVGQCDIIERDASKEKLIDTLQVDWQIFPPGTSVDSVVRAVIGRTARPSAEEEAIIRDRLELFRSLGPKNFIRGSGGMSGYVGAMFADDLVVFENVRSGNALYVLYDDWQQVSQRSRIDLIRSGGSHFDRFAHRADWKKRFAAHLRSEIAKRGLPKSGLAVG